MCMGEKISEAYGEKYARVAYSLNSFIKCIKLSSIHRWMHDVSLGQNWFYCRHTAQHEKTGGL